MSIALITRVYFRRHKIRKRCKEVGAEEARTRLKQNKEAKAKLKKKEEQNDEVELKKREVGNEFIGKIQKNQEAPNILEKT